MDEQYSGDENRPNHGERPQWDEGSHAFQFAKRVVERLQSSGYVAYFAGGCVRDAWMGNPASDYDVATDAKVEQVIELFGPRNTLAIGAAFGVACVHGKLEGQRQQVEVATFRSDGLYSDGRRPDWVTFSSPEEDAKRRDFTINGMFYDPVAGQLKDFVGGKEDLRLGKLRAIGVAEERFSEDKLRMLRAVRFAARFGFEIESETAEAIRRHASEITQVSGERIGVEMEKLLETSRPRWGMQVLWELGLLRYLWSPLASRWDETPSRRTYDWLVFDSIPPGSSVATFLAAGVDGEPELTDLQQAWKLSNERTLTASFASFNAQRLCDAQNEAWSDLQPLLIHRAIPAALGLAKGIAAAKGLGTAGVERCQRALLLPRSELDPAPFLTGADLKGAKLRPGPEYAKLLREARALQLDGKHTTRSEALEWLKKRAEGMR